jgi:hypothetical protein
MAAAVAPSYDVFTSTFYMDREAKLEHEKPYELRFQPPKGYAAANTTWSKYSDIPVRDIRGHEEEFSISRNGFEVRNLETSLSYDDFDDTTKVEGKYLKEVAQLLKERLGAARVLVFDYMVCNTSAKRSITTVADFSIGPEKCPWIPNLQWSGQQT